MEKAVFFDRDGVIIKNVNGEAPIKISNLKLIPEIIPVILSLKGKGYKIIVVSNQPDIALGRIDGETKIRLVKKFKELLKGNNIFADGIYYCFHHPKGKVKKYAKNCRCRKPKPGMFLKAMHRYNIDPKKSYIIGDRATDIKAGSLAGVKTILFDPKNSEVNYLLEYQVRPDFIVKNFNDILDIISL